MLSLFPSNFYLRKLYYISLSKPENHIHNFIIMALSGPQSITLPFLFIIQPSLLIPTSSYKIFPGSGTLSILFSLFGVFFLLLTKWLLTAYGEDRFQILSVPQDLHNSFLPQMEGVYVFAFIDPDIICGWF